MVVALLLTGLMHACVELLLQRRPQPPIDPVFTQRFALHAAIDDERIVPNARQKKFMEEWEKKLSNLE